MASSSQDFLLECLGGAAPFDWSDEEGDEVGMTCLDEADAGQPAAMAMAMDDSSDEEADGDLDIDDAYSFDPEQVAKMVKAGKTSQAELVETIQEAMAAALERRLRRQEANPSIEPGADNPYAAIYSGATCEDDLSGRMTPPLSPTGPQLAQKGHARSRRSSIARQDAISQAMKDAVARHRQSVAKRICDEGELIREAMGKAQRRHRMSVSKAAEVIQAAEPEDEAQAMADNDKVAQQLAAVQQAMELARKRHRRSIAEAVKHVSADVPTFSQASSSVEDRIQQAVQALTSQHVAHEKIQQALDGALSRNTVDQQWQSPCTEGQGYTMHSETEAVGNAEWQGEQYQAEYSAYGQYDEAAFAHETVYPAESNYQAAYGHETLPNYQAQQLYTTATQYEAASSAYEYPAASQYEADASYTSDLQYQAQSAVPWSSCNGWTQNSYGQWSCEAKQAAAPQWGMAAWGSA